MDEQFAYFGRRVLIFRFILEFGAGSIVQSVRGLEGPRQCQRQPLLPLVATAVDQHFGGHSFSGT